MPKKLIAFIVFAAVIAVTPGLLALTNGLGLLGLTGQVSDWFVPVDAASLVRSSDRIVLARYLDETVHGTPNSPTAHAESPTSFVDVYRRFEVLESLKGGFIEGDTAHVGWHGGYYRRAANGEPEYVRGNEILLSPGETYVLFLNLRHGRRPPDLDVRDRVWRTRDGLDVARVDPQGRLSFETTRYYRNALKDMGLKPMPGSGAPFDLTIMDIRELVENDPPSDG